jgi:hypothetical protein
MEEASGNEDMFEIIGLKPNLEGFGWKAENRGVRSKTTLSFDTTH